MSAKVGAFLSGWRQLNEKDKNEGLVAFVKQKPLQSAESLPQRMVVSEEAIKFPRVYEKIRLSVYYSYLRYYPTMHWNLDRTPETDDYWVGIYEKRAADDQYITYQWVGKTAQGSYYIGNLGSTRGRAGDNRYDEFELRIFNGSCQRLDAETTILRGRVIVAPCNPLEIAEKSEETTVAMPPLDPEILDFIRAIEANLSNSEMTSQPASWDVLYESWEGFSYDQRQLLYPILEQQSLPEEIRKPGPKKFDRPEPKVLYPELGKTKPLTAADDLAAAPNTIVLSITINRSYTYICPSLNIIEAIPKDYAWMGMYRTER